MSSALALVCGVQGDAAEDDHGVSVGHVDDEVGVVGAEAPLERCCGVRQAAELQQLAGPVGLEQLQRPRLARLMGGTDPLGDRGQRLVEAVHHGQDLAAEITGQPPPGILADAAPLRRAASVRASAVSKWPRVYCNMASASSMVNRAALSWVAPTASLASSTCCWAWSGRTATTRL